MLDAVVSWLPEQVRLMGFYGTADLPNLFPESSKTGGDTAALPAIWANKADFDAKAAKFVTDAKQAQTAVKDLDTFKASFSTVTKDCGACHETYRAKKS